MQLNLDAFIPEAHRLLAEYASVIECTFVLGGMPVSADEVFSPMGLLPLIALRADERMMENFSTGLGMRLVRAPGAMLGYEVTIEELDGMDDGSSSLRLFHLAEAADTVLGLDRSACVELDPLLQRFSQSGEPKGGSVSWPQTKVHLNA